MLVLRLLLIAVLVFFIAVTLVVIGEELGIIAGIATFAVLLTLVILFIRFQFRRM